MNGKPPPRQLTPTIGCLLTIAALGVGLSTAARMAWWTMREPPGHVEDRLRQERYETNWLPGRDQIVRIRAKVVEIVDDMEEVKIVRLPLQSAGAILDRFANKTEWTAPPRPKGVTVSYDFQDEFVIELVVDDMTYPVSLGFTRWGGVWIGDSLFVLPADDFRKLQNLVYGHSTGVKVSEEAADDPPPTDDPGPAGLAPADAGLALQTYFFPGRHKHELVNSKSASAQACLN